MSYINLFILRTIKKTYVQDVDKAHSHDFIPQMYSKQRKLLKKSMNIQRHRIKTVIFVLTNNIQGYIISNIFSAYILEGCVFMAIYPVYNPVFIYSSFSSFPNALMYTPVAIPIPGTIVFCKIYTPGYIPQIIYST